MINILNKKGKNNNNDNKNNEKTNNISTTNNNDVMDKNSSAIKSFIIDSNINVYNELKNVYVTNEAEIKRYFIMNYYQTIPRYYLLCNNKDINTAIYNFSVGSGKTAAGLYVILNNVDLYKKYIFNKQFMPQVLKQNASFEVKKNVIVIGSWVTTTAVINELCKEEFGFIKKEEIQAYKKLLNSNIIEDRKHGEKLKQQINKKIEQYIDFYGYQKFVNNCFPNLNIASISQDTKILIDNYINNNLSISNDFKERLKNNIIIVDECQKLYSFNGLNSFGFAIMCVVKLAKELNIKVVFLSGTMFNTSLAELVPIVNIMSEHNLNTYEKYKTPKGIFIDNDCLESTELIEGFQAMTPTKEFLNVAKELLKDRFIYYNHSEVNNDVDYKGSLYQMIPITNTNSKYQYNTKAAKLKQNVINDESLLLRFPKRPNLPIEQHIGNIAVYNKDNTEIKMLLYSCEVYGIQKQQYKKYLQNNAYQNIDLNEEENEQTVTIHDVGLPPSKDFIKNGIVHNNSGYIGKFLEKEQLKNYSTIGYNLINLCIDKTTKNEKVIVYHNKLNNFGIFQYMLILGTNGFIKFGESPKNNSICKTCGKSYSLHNEDLETRLKHGCCNKFKPIYYYYLVGSMSPQERENIVGNVFNNPKNLYGDLLSIMFVSDVAYSGVSFLNTNNIVLLSKISNISKWTQICARIIRTKSHNMLPYEKRYANIYTMVIHYPDEQKVFNTKFTYEQKYYIVRTLLNENIEQYLEEFTPKTIGYKLFNEPDKITYDDVEQNRLIKMYSNDINKNINNLIDKYVRKFPNKIWKLKTFIKRLCDPKESYTYLNLSKINKTYLVTVLSNNKNIMMFKYQSDNTNDIYINFVDNTDKGKAILTTFTYRDIESIPKNETILYNLLDKLDKSEFLIHRRLYMNKILKFIGNKYDLLTNQQIWWDNIYKVHDEYYDDDENNFILNHRSSNRNPSKMTGFYNGEFIILRTGEVKRINITFPKYNGWKNIPYKFRISCLNTSMSAPFYLHVNIARKQETQEDARRISKGVTCLSFDAKEIEKYLGIRKDKYDNKAEMCIDVMQKLIDKQAENMDDRNLYTPFEK